jgi:hypothetical protein
VISFWSGMTQCCLIWTGRPFSFKLPFDEHWFIALAAPRAFIALEGTHGQNVNANGVRQAWLAAQPAFALLNVKDRRGVSWAD